MMATTAAGKFSENSNCDLTGQRLLELNEKQFSFSEFVFNLCMNLARCIASTIDCS